MNEPITGFFSEYGIFWLLCGFLAVGISIFWRWKMDGTTFTLGHAALSLCLTLFGPVLFGGIIIYVMCEIVNWDAPILKGKEYYPRYNRDID